MYLSDIQQHCHQHPLGIETYKFFYRSLSITIYSLMIVIREHMIS